MHTMSGAVSFFELGVEDAQKGRAFYEGLFGWGFETGPSGQRLGAVDAGVPGGMHPGDAGAVPYVFFAVEDMDAAIERVKALGRRDRGLRRRRRRAIEARFGRFKFCKDDQGSAFGLHQPPA